MTVAFDTLKLARRLEAAGFSTRQAQDTAEALAETLTATVATQGDVRELGLQLRTEIASLGAELRMAMAGLRTEMQSLRTEMQSLRAELLKWAVGIGVAAVLAIGGMILTLGIAILRALPHP